MGKYHTWLHIEKFKIKQYVRIRYRFAIGLHMTRGYTFSIKNLDKYHTRLHKEKFKIEQCVRIG